MLGKMPNELKMQIATVILESHKINATTMNDSNKLDHTTTKYTEIPTIHKALTEEHGCVGMGGSLYSLGINA